ncbi:MAG: 6-carboxytetrahydropterin synthase QueD [Deltaproteobacteria bacterium RBG_16_50_11]|nr:MAG: 6-carboxytetrahydropterin synthase QueD [Deltaproteobacteria bacterium RBG_16_50_11]
MKYEITVLSHFSSAHRLRYLHGKCEELHGHNWKIEATVASSRLKKEGIVIDFKILKDNLEKVLKSLDHVFLNDLPYFSDREPSSENISKYIFDRLKEELKKLPGTLKKVTAWESETSYATYFGSER